MADPALPYTLNEVAAILRCSNQTVRKEILRGRLGYFKVGKLYRIPRAALDTYLEGPCASISSPSETAPTDPDTGPDCTSDGPTPVVDLTNFRQERGIAKVPREHGSD